MKYKVNQKTPTGTAKYLLVAVGIVIGLALPFLVDLVLFGDPTPLNITKQYEDGSFVGCIAEAPCND